MSIAILVPPRSDRIWALKTLSDHTLTSFSAVIPFHPSSRSWRNWRIPAFTLIVAITRIAHPKVFSLMKRTSIENGVSNNRGTGSTLSLLRTVRKTDTHVWLVQRIGEMIRSCCVVLCAHLELNLECVAHLELHLESRI